MAQRMDLYLQDKHDIRYEIEIAKYAEEKGFSEIWQADTRNPAVIAATWSTMWEPIGASRSPPCERTSRPSAGSSRWRRSLTRVSSSTSTECVDAGVTCPILYPLMPDIKPVVDAFTDWTP